MNPDTHSQPRLIVDGAAALDEILSSISHARKTIRIRAYMWRDDATGRQLISALIEKSNQNSEIEIFIEKDAFGSKIYDLQRFISLGRLRGDVFSGEMGKKLISMKQNVHFSLVGSPSILLFKYFKENDHSKVFLFDENTHESHALIGGMNIGDEYLTAQNHDDPDSGGWHDYMVAMEGELADSIVSPFHPEKAKWITRKIREGVEILINLKSKRTIRQQILSEISRAKKSIVIQHAYITDMAIVRKLRSMSRKGVKVTIILPDRSDGVWHANIRSVFKLLRPDIITKQVKEFSDKFKKFEMPVTRKILSSIREISPENLQVFLYHGMIHAKAIVIDDSVAILGSANLTYGSFDFLNETNAIFRQKEGVVSELIVQLQKDLKNCRRITLDTIPPHNRYIAWIQKIFI